MSPLVYIGTCMQNFSSFGRLVRSWPWGGLKIDLTSLEDICRTSPNDDTIFTFTGWRNFICAPSDQRYLQIFLAREKVWLETDRGYVTLHLPQFWLHDQVPRLNPQAPFRQHLLQSPPLIPISKRIFDLALRSPTNRRRGCICKYCDLIGCDVVQSIFHVSIIDYEGFFHLFKR